LRVEAKPESARSSDRLARLGPQQQLAFAVACTLERLRRAAIAGLKRVRDLARGRS
jgi:hypothetical protein